MENNTQNRLIYVIIAILLVVAAIFWISDINKLRSNQQSPNQNTNWQTYSNEEFNFSLQYPDKFNQVSGDFTDYPVGSYLVDQKEEQGSVPVIASIIIDETNYANTNLSGAWVTTSVLEGTTETECRTIVDGTDVVELSEGQATLDIPRYERDWQAEGAAGTKFESRVYHMFKDNHCYEVALHLATSNIGNYDPGTVTAVDEGGLRAELRSVADTFKFTD